MCGGTSVGVYDQAAHAGLSPRVRGNRTIRSRGAAWGRSIPACAGEPRRRLKPSPHLSVYPRVCGGTLSRPQPESYYRGLSPRVRGNRVVGEGKGSDKRSIPACAGEPFESRLPEPIYRVYPRVCGGTTTPLTTAGGGAGLSPRVRGNQDSIDANMAHTGSIPACAGEPSIPRRPERSCRVYPRVCGGTAAEACDVPAEDGLSPRVRGNLTITDADAIKDGSIPACAGEPDRI